MSDATGRGESTEPVALEDARPLMIVELRDAVKEMRAADHWSSAERTLLNKISSDVCAHLVNEEQRRTREAGETLTELLRQGHTLDEALAETRRIFGELYDKVGHPISW